MKKKMIFPNSSFLTACSLDSEEVFFRTCKKGRMLDDRLDGKHCAAYIRQGAVDVYSVSSDGREVRLNVLKSGECFGICNLFEEKEMETVLRCREETVLICIPKHILVRKIRETPEAAEKYAMLCNRKLQYLLKRIGILTTQSSRNRLISYLVEEKRGERLEESREALAECLGISRAQLFRELAFLKKEKVLAPVNRQLCVVDRERLFRMYETGFQDSSFI